MGQRSMQFSKCWTLPLPAWGGGPPVPTAAQTKLTWQRIEKVVQGALDTPLPEFDDERETEDGRGASCAR